MKIRRIFLLILAFVLTISCINLSAYAGMDSGTTISADTKQVKDSKTGRTYNYVNYFDGELWRPYMTNQTWTSDGKSFLCGTKAGDMFLYNTVKEEFVFLDSNVCSTIGRIHATVGEDDCIYYIKSTTRAKSVWKIDTKSYEKEKLFEAEGSAVIYTPSVSNDCNFLTFEMHNAANYYVNSNEWAICRYSVKDKKLDVIPKKFEVANALNHDQINPVFTNLVFFAHEASEQGIDLLKLYDRSNVADFNANTTKNIIEQGCYEDGKIALFPTHETWSYNGEHLYFVNLLGNTDKNVKGPCVMRVDKDGRHRRFYYSDESASYAPNHAYASKDERYVVSDSHFIHLINTDTNQVFPICEIENETFSKGHPYEPHPIIARNRYVTDWGHVVNGVLGVAWYDFSSIDENEIAKGGKIKLNTDVEYIDYEDLDCDVSQNSEDGRDYLYIPQNNKLYVDINDKIVDSVNTSLNFSFDFYDDSTNPIVITYTKGAINDNDLASTENQKILIERKGTNKWKTASLFIKSGNFEGSGKYSSDLSIAGGAYVGNIHASAIDGESEYENPLTIKSIISSGSKLNIKLISKNCNNGVVIAVKYDENGLLNGVVKKSFVFSRNAAEIEELDICSIANDGDVKLLFWKDINNPIPLCQSVNYKNITPTITEKANGVIIAWDDLNYGGIYEIYRDGEKIGTTVDTEYSDKYFDTVEDMEQNNSNEKHIYYVKSGNKISNSVCGGANTSLLKYIDFSGITPQTGNFNELNQKSMGIKMAAEHQDWNGQFAITKNSKETEYTLSDNSLLRTMYYTDCWGAYSGNGYSAIEPSEHALVLSNNVCAEKKRLVQMTSYAKVTGFNDTIANDNNFSEYTFLINQKANNSMITSVKTPIWSVNLLKSGDSELVGDVKAINPDGSVLPILKLSDYSYQPINDACYRTYIFNAKAKLNGNTTLHAYQPNIDANLRFTNCGETSGEALLIRSIGIVKSTDYISDSSVTISPKNNMNMIITSSGAANGVSLSWQDDNSNNTYKIYRDGEMIAATSDHEYNDIYFRTVEEIPNCSALGMKHSYYVTSSNSATPIIYCKPDLSLIKSISFDSITAKPEKLSEANIGANGISLYTHKDLPDAFVESTKIDEEKTYNLNDGNTVSTKYVFSKKGFAGAQSVCVDPSEGGLVLANLYNGDGTVSVLSPYFRVDGEDFCLNEYTILLTQKVMNTNIEKVWTPCVTLSDRVVAHAQIIGNISSIDESGKMANVVTADEYSFYPKQSNDFYTYVFDTEAYFNTDTAFAWDTSKRASIRIDGKQVNSGLPIIVKSLAVIRKSDYLR